MKIIIHGVRIEVTAAIKSHVEEKIGMLAHHMDPKHADLAEARVEVGKPSEHHHKGEVFYAEVNLKMGKEFMRATVTKNDLYTAINDCRNELERQLDKHKTKEKEHRR